MTDTREEFKRRLDQAGLQGHLVAQSDLLQRRDLPHDMKIDRIMTALSAICQYLGNEKIR